MDAALPQSDFFRFLIDSDLLSSLTSALLDPGEFHQFKNTIANSTRKINIQLCDEGEQFGINESVYDSLVTHSGSSRLGQEKFLL